VRVAFITPYFLWPADTGGKLRSYYLLKGLAEAADVDFYTVAHGEAPDPAPLKRLCSRVEIVRLRPRPQRREQVAGLLSPLPRSVRYFHTAESLAELREMLDSQPYDLLVCDEICMTPYVEELVANAHTPRLVIRHKVDHLHYEETAAYRPWGEQKLLDLLEARRLKRYEDGKMPLFAGALVCSEDDGRVVSQQGRNLALRIIVNGADVDYFTLWRCPDPAPTLLILGTMHYYPNIDAAHHFFQTMYPALSAALPDLHVLVVGHGPPAEIQRYGELPGVVVTGSVPDVRPYMARSWVMAVPLRLGGGTRLKIVESMAAGLPVVSTTVGAQGLEVSDGVEIMLADAPEVFVGKCIQLLQDAPLREQMAARGRSMAEEKYSWRRMGERFAEFCYAVAGKDYATRQAEAQVRPPYRVGEEEEVAFWDAYLAEAGGVQGVDFQLRCDPELRLQSYITDLLSAPLDATVDILDVGAGPLTFLGKRWGQRNVRITAIDPLAERYNRLLEKYGITPPVRTQVGEAEGLTSLFAENSFDLVHARNVIDHSRDPVAVLEQMVAVTKPGGLVYLHHHSNEVETQQYTGMHQWNFYMRDDHLFVGNRSRSFDLTEILTPVAEVENHLPGGGWIVTLIRKRPQPSTYESASNQTTTLHGQSVRQRKDNES
jgi:glycosyltransferase involved in cell wall biosynthesis